MEFFSRIISIIIAAGIIIYIWCNYIPTDLPEKEIPPEVYGIANPIEFNNKPMYFDLNTSIALFGINITYKFDNIRNNGKINYSEEITTLFKIWIIKAHISPVEQIYKKVTSIVVKGIGSIYKGIYYNDSEIFSSSNIDSLPINEYLNSLLHKSSLSILNQI